MSRWRFFAAALICGLLTVGAAPTSRAVEGGQRGDRALELVPAGRPLAHLVVAPLARWPELTRRYDAGRGFEALTRLLVDQWPRLDPGELRQLVPRPDRLPAAPWVLPPVDEAFGGQAARRIVGRSPEKGTLTLALFGPTFPGHLPIVAHQVVVLASYDAATAELGRPTLTIWTRLFE